VKIKFHSNGNIEWQCMHLELSTIQFNSIGIKFNSDSWLIWIPTLIGIWSELPICRRLLCTKPWREIISKEVTDNQVRDTPPKNAISSTKNIHQRTFVHSDMGLDLMHNIHSRIRSYGVSANVPGQKWIAAGFPESLVSQNGHLLVLFQISTAHSVHAPAWLHGLKHARCFNSPPPDLFLFFLE
jgi:hypothetical protein